MAGRATGRLLDPGRRSDEPVPLHEIEIEVMPRFGCMRVCSAHMHYQPVKCNRGSRTDANCTHLSRLLSTVTSITKHAREVPGPVARQGTGVWRRALLAVPYMCLRVLSVCAWWRGWRSRAAFA